MHYHAGMPAKERHFIQDEFMAGRDGEPADAILFYRAVDMNIYKFFAENENRQSHSPSGRWRCDYRNAFR